MPMLAADLLTWVIIIVATAGVIARPFRLPEAIWVVTGAALLVAFGLLPISAAFSAVIKGSDVYLFLHRHDAVRRTRPPRGPFRLGLAALGGPRSAKGSPRLLFVLVYAVGVLVTVFLSNDATAVVSARRPSIAAASAAGAEPLPYLFICAFVANAASFVLPISNPANLVALREPHAAARRLVRANLLYRRRLPSLATFFALAARLRRRAKGLQDCGRIGLGPVLSLRAGKLAACRHRRTPLSCSSGASAADVHPRFADRACPAPLTDGRRR